MSKYIEFKNVKKIYKMGEVNIEALSGVNFSVDKGEFVVVAGASGAGKSTILNILGGMDNLFGGKFKKLSSESSFYLPSSAFSALSIPQKLNPSTTCCINAEISVLHKLPILPSCV